VVLQVPPKQEPATQVLRTDNSVRELDTPLENRQELPYSFRIKKSNLQAVRAKHTEDSEIGYDEEEDMMNLGPGGGPAVHKRDGLMPDGGVIN
jgi:hypothetical protein